MFVDRSRCNFKRQIELYIIYAQCWCTQPLIAVTSDDLVKKKSLYKHVVASSFKDKMKTDK